MRSSRPLILASALAAAAAVAAPEIRDPEAGNVSTTSLTLCWLTTEPAEPGLEVFADAAASQSLAGEVRIEFQPLGRNRREVGSTPATRDSTRALQQAISARNLVLARASGLTPGTDYWIRPLALGGGGATLASGPLIQVTTAATAAFVVESRQLVVDLSSLVPLLGDVEGVIVRAANATSPHPLFAVVGDAPSSTLAYLDLSHFLDGTGESNLDPGAGNLDLSLSWKGAPAAPGAFAGDSVSFTGSPVVAESSTAAFNAETTPVVLVALGGKPKAVVGLPFPLLVFATDGTGQALAQFNRPVVIGHPALHGSPITSPALAGGVLIDHPLHLQSPGTHTLTISDSAGPATTTLDVETVPMTYANWREYHFGSPDSGPGDPGGNDDNDQLFNDGEFVFVTDPRSPSGSVVAPSRTPDGGLSLRFSINPTQSEYVVVVQVASDFNDWRASAKVPVLVESMPDRKLMEVSWSPAELAAETGAPGGQPPFFARLLVQPAP